MPNGPMVASRALREALGALEPDPFSGDDCATLAEDLARTEKACAAARARLAVRAAEAGAHHRRGYARPLDWLARSAGSSLGQAREVLGTVAALEECPRTKEAVVSGELSLTQGAEIAKTEATRPGVEAELVSLAKASSLQVLRDKARRRRHRAMHTEELFARQQAAR